MNGMLVMTISKIQYNNNNCSEVKVGNDVTVARSMNKQQEVENRMLMLSECGTKREYMFFH